MRLASSAMLALSMAVGDVVAVPPGSSAWAYYYFVHFIAMGDADGALAQFADDAVVTAGARCRAVQPCAGKAAIRDRYLLPLIQRGHGAPVRNAQFIGRALHTQGECFIEWMPQGDAVGRSGGHRFEFHAGLIRALAVELDATDAFDPRCAVPQTPQAFSARGVRASSASSAS
jgi:hypothetical protein